MSAESDAALVARVVVGDDRTAFELLVRRHQSPLRAQARFTTWLYRIAYRVFLDHRRSQVRDVGELADEVAYEPDAAIAAADQMDADIAMRLLSERQRAVFDLFYGKGMTHDEVAQALDVPAGTVKSDLHRGVERLRCLLLEKETAR